MKQLIALFALAGCIPDPFGKDLRLDPRDPEKVQLEYVEATAKGMMFTVIDACRREHGLPEGTARVTMRLAKDGRFEEVTIIPPRGDRRLVPCAAEKLRGARVLDWNGRAIDPELLTAITLDDEILDDRPVQRISRVLNDAFAAGFAACRKQFDGSRTARARVYVFEDGMLHDFAFEEIAGDELAACLRDAFMATKLAGGPPWPRWIDLAVVPET